MKLSPPPLVPARIRAIVFDLDGTLVDSYEAITAGVDHARAAFGLGPVEQSEIRLAVGHGAQALLARYVGPERAHEGVRLFQSRYAEVLEQGTRALPGVVATLAALDERGYALAVASNKPSRFTARIVDLLGLRERFGAVLGPEDAGSEKPDPAMIRRCLRELGAEAGTAAYVGDMVLDVESAARAGVAAILVLGGSSPEPELRQTGQVVLRSIDELLELLPAQCG